MGEEGEGVTPALRRLVAGAVTQEVNLHTHLCTINTEDIKSMLNTIQRLPVFDNFSNAGVR